jgi:hypothetical protein
MRQLRTRKSFALFGLAVVVFAALVPSVASGLHDIVLVPLWVVTEAPPILLVRRAESRGQAQPLALLSLALFRAPPDTLPVA